MIRNWFAGLDPLLKIALVLFAIAAVLILLFGLVFPAAAEPAAGYAPPASIVAPVRLTNVYCTGPCCCGQAQLVYRGYWYDRPLGYCRWFRPLVEGQVVTTTLWLVK